MSSGMRRGNSCLEALRGLCAVQVLKIANSADWDWEDQRLSACLSFVL